MSFIPFVNKRQPADSRPSLLGYQKTMFADNDVKHASRLHVLPQLSYRCLEKTACTPQQHRTLIRRLKPIAATLLVCIGMLGSAYFGLQIIKARQPLTVYPSPTPAGTVKKEPAAATLPRSTPSRLRIPDVGIDTALLTVGRLPDNTMEVPEPAEIAGWYKHGPTPGELGPAIIVGHVDSPRGPAVFWRLRELQPGHTIEVQREDGRTVRFTVTAVKQFEQDSFPTSEVYGNIDYAGLRLITCGGSFNRSTGSYSHNTVVYATLINQ